MEITSLVVVALQITTRDATDSALVAEKVIKKITRSLRSLDDFFWITFLATCAESIASRVVIGNATTTSYVISIASESALQ